MAKRRYTAEEIVTVLRQVEVSIANGKGTPQACRDFDNPVWPTSMLTFGPPVFR